MIGEITERGQVNGAEDKDRQKPRPTGYIRAKTFYIYFSSQGEATQAILDFWQQRDPNVIKRINEGLLFVDGMITEGSRTVFAPVDSPHLAQGYSHAIAISDNGVPLNEHTIKAVRNLGFEIEGL